VIGLIMAIALVQFKLATAGANNNISATFTNPTTAGNLIVAGVQNGTSVSSVSDGTNTYELVVAQASSLVANCQAQALYYAWNAASKSTISSVSVGAGTVDFIGCLFIAEFSGVQNSSDPLNVKNSNSHSSGSTATTPTVSLAGTAATDLIIGLADSGGGLSAAGTGMTVVAQEGGTSTGVGLLEYGILAGGTVSVQAGPNDEQWLMIAAAFKAAGAGSNPNTLFFGSD
jgi:hypothetical protein